MFVAIKEDAHIHIDRIDMDGSIQSLIHMVEYGLTGDEIILHFDTITRLLYFTDYKNGIIDSVSEDGDYYMNYNLKNLLKYQQLIILNY